MFSLSLVDTLRLAFGQVVYHHKSHTEAAAACARWSRWFRAVEAVLMLGVLISALATAFARGQAFAFTGAVLAGAAMLVFLLHMVFDFEASSRAHHLSGVELWHLREQYRSLLADLRDD